MNETLNDSKYIASNKFDPELNFQIIFTASVLVINALTFIIYYFKNKTYSNLTNLKMAQCVSDSICYYCLMIVLFDIPMIVDFFKIRTVFSLLTLQDGNITDDYYINYKLHNRTIIEEDLLDNLHPEVYLLTKINNCLFSSAFTFSICLQIFLCSEIIQMFKDPISDFSKRPKFYYFSSLIISIFSFFLSFYFLFSKAMENINLKGYIKIIFVFWGSQDLNEIILIFYIPICLFTIFYLINILRSKSKLLTKEKVLFSSFQIIYFLFYLGFWIIPIINHYYKEKADLKIVILCMNVSGLIMCLLRIMEMADFRGCQNYNEEIEDEGNYNQFESNNEIRLSEVTLKSKDESAIDNINENHTSRFKSIKSVKIEMPLSSYLSNSMLSEYMYFIITGILTIGKEVDKIKTNPYFINKESYSEICHHNFSQINMSKVKDMTDLSEIQIKSKIHQSSIFQFSSLCRLCDRSIRLIEYSPKVFRNILALDSLDHFELMKSFEIKKNLDNLSKLSISEGKSGSFFFFTHDSRFIIKTISDTELSTIKNDFLQPYYELITENYNTLLTRTYGAYTLSVGLTRITVVLLENLSPIENSLVNRRFDLKGSLLGRQTKNLNLYQKSKTLKDLDFLEFKRIYPDLINLDEKSIITILETLKYDLNLLRNCSLMDYSFFITIAENKKCFSIDTCLVSNRAYVSKDEKYIYFVGIIDYLTIFNNYKQIENKYKTLLNYSHRNSISAVNPVLYAERFSKFITEKLFNIK